MFTPRFFRAILIACLTVSIFISSTLNAEETVAQNWWENGMFTAEGFGAPPPQSNNPGEARMIARHAAITDACKKLAMQASGLRITATQTMSNDEMKALIKSAKIESEEYDGYGNCTVVMSVSIFGGTGSVARTVFKPVERKEFPTPQLDKSSAPIKKEGNYTGLIIDCGDLELNPVLAPVIRNEKDQSIYSYENLEYEKVVEHGMVSYARKELELEKNAEGDEDVAADDDRLARAGSNPLIIKASKMGDDNSCPVISTDDANKILVENGASHFLDNSSVVFMSNKIRGIRL